MRFHERSVFSLLMWPGSSSLQVGDQGAGSQPDHVLAERGQRRDDPQTELAPGSAGRAAGGHARKIIRGAAKPAA